jgi:hypothetical protein
MHNRVAKTMKNMLFRFQGEANGHEAQIDNVLVGIGTYGDASILVFGAECDEARKTPEKPESTGAYLDCFVIGGPREEVEADIRDMFANRHDGCGNREDWPEPAATLFATLPWRFVN